MARTVTFSSYLADVSTPSVGRRLSALTLTIKNAQLVTKGTLTFPFGVSELVSGGSYTYQVTDYDVEDQTIWPATYIVVDWTGTDFVTGEVTTWSEVVSIDTTQTIPEVEDGRLPYADLAYSLTYMNGMRRGSEWIDLAGMTPGDAYRLLIEASDDIDTEHFKGEKLRVYAYDNSQSARQFPRIFSQRDTVGYFTATTEMIPSQIKMACVEQALWIHQQEMRGHDYENRSEIIQRGITGLSRGKSSENYQIESAKRSRLCQRALELIRPYLAHGIQDTAGGY